MEKYSTEDDTIVAEACGDRIASHLCGLGSYICHAHFTYFLRFCSEPSLITAEDERNWGLALEAAVDALAASKAVKKTVWCKEHTPQIQAMAQYQRKALQMIGQLKGLDAGDELDAATAQSLHNILSGTKFDQLEVYEEDDMENLIKLHTALATPERMSKLRNFFCAEGSSKLIATRDAILTNIGVGGASRIGAMFARHNVEPDWPTLEKLSAGLAPCVDNVTALLPLASKLDDPQLKAQLGVIDGFVTSIRASISFATSFERVRKLMTPQITDFDHTFFQNLSTFVRQMNMCTTFYTDHKVSARL